MSFKMMDNDIIRGGLMFLFCLFLSFVLIKVIIRLTRNKKFHSTTQENLEKIRGYKDSVSALGGIAFLIAFPISAFIFLDLKNPVSVLIICTFLAFGIIGLVDDLFKLKNKDKDNLQSNSGLSIKSRTAMQVVFSLIIAVSINAIHPFTNTVFIPFLDLAVDLGWFYFVFVFIVMFCTVSGFNFTDGIDGQAGKVAISVLTSLAVLTVIVSNIDIATMFNLQFLDLTSEVFVALLGSIGMMLAFLWFNTKPAKIFMGDSGSYSVGALIAISAIIIKQEILFALFAIILVVEFVSSLLQVLYFRSTKIIYGKGKKIFLMAPYHHHLEMKGISRNRIATIFTIVSIVSSVFVFIALRLTAVI
ncbi:MAG: phospho-N-acetylmuramoyl-pentapeptide-transferase [Alphaproteobacteria bacterium]|nr:phospho-N-acetylmuramoyl-pentapeptide-transferase [Alphaproteobacteria bacterium]MBL0717858.1 phospho-N-acetylmuramoyl-pentapeptide-transferase [Alphaproteobacteria bacterium]